MCTSFFQCLLNVQQSLELLLVCIHCFLQELEPLQYSLENFFTIVKCIIIIIWHLSHCFIKIISTSQMFKHSHYATPSSSSVMFMCNRMSELLPYYTIKKHPVQGVLWQLWKCQLSWRPPCVLVYFIFSMFVKCATITWTSFSLYSVLSSRVRASSNIVLRIFSQ